MKYVLALLIAMVPGGTFAQCAPDDRICNQAVADQARQRDEQTQRDAQRTRDLNYQNGTSQYSGPSCYKTANGNLVCGGQVSGQ